MSEYFIKLIISLEQAIESNHIKEIVKYLSVIRKDTTWPKYANNIKKLRETGGLSLLSNVLNSHSFVRNIVDLALSILGNCCMHKEAAKNLMRVNYIIPTLHSLLKRYPKEDSVNGRIFRIIGNLCLHTELFNTSDVISPQIITLIVEYLNRKAENEVENATELSNATILLALRCIRLSVNIQTIEDLVKTYKVLGPVGAIFINYCIFWKKEKKYEDVLVSIIRVLHEYSKFKYNRTVLELRRTSKGDCLAHLSDVLILCPKKIIKIIMNTIKMCNLKSELPVEKICDKFIEVLDTHSFLKEFHRESIEYLHCLRQLLEHPANRNNERVGKCIPVLIRVFQEIQTPSKHSLDCCCSLLDILSQFEYDDKLMIMQLKSNIGQALIDKLTWYSGPSKVFNPKHKFTKKKLYKLLNPLPKTKARKFGSFGFVFEENPDEEPDNFFIAKRAFERSPSPCTSSDSDSRLWESPFSSPSQNKHTEVSDSDDYSPVCSDNESAADAPHLSFAEPDCDPSFDMDDERYDQRPPYRSYPNLKFKLLTEIIRLIKIFTRLRQAGPHLANYNFLKALLMCYNSSDNINNQQPNFDTIVLISKILKSFNCLIPLMQTNIIHEIYSLTEFQHKELCNKCFQNQYVGQYLLNAFTNLAESGGGKGDIAHELLKGDLDVREALVLTIPLIVQDKTILVKLMINCGGLDILMRLLQQDNEVQKTSIKVLCAMASRKLSIPNPAVSNITPPRAKLSADKYEEPVQSTEIVTFKLDDGSLIKANKEFLSQKSDFFSRLLNGDFKESKEEIIALQNVELKSLRCLLNLLQIVDKMKAIDVDLDLKTILDVILLSDRYLLVDLCSSLTDCVQQFKIDVENVPIIYRWSIATATNLLRVESVAFALVADVSNTERMSMFASLFELGCTKQLVEDIGNLLRRYLNLGVSEPGSETSAKRQKYSDFDIFYQS